MLRVGLKYHPHKHQEAFHGSGARIKAMVAGARSGKTLGGAQEMAIIALSQPGYQQKDIDEGKPYTIACGAPTYKMLQRFVIPEMLRAIPEKIVVSWNKSEYRLVVRAHGKGRFTHILFINCERSDRWEGLQLYAVWLDEAAQMKEEIYDEARTRVMDRKGLILLTGTPKGKNWVFYKIYERSLEDAKVFCEQFPTSANPYFPVEELAEAKATTSEKYYRRTHEASFEEFAGQVYDEYKKGIHVVEDYPVDDWGDHHFDPIIAGVDWGFNNPGAILVIGVDWDGGFWILDEIYERGMLVNAPEGASKQMRTWVRVAKGLRKKWGITQFMCDPAQPAYIESFLRAGLPAIPAMNAVHPGIEAVSNVMHVDPRTEVPRLYIMDTCRETLREITSYRWAESRMTGEPLESPVKENDHAMDAMRYAIATYQYAGPEPEFIDQPLMPV